jgi:hypothetical protein
LGSSARLVLGKARTNVQQMKTVSNSRCRPKQGRRGSTAGVTQLE